MTSYDKAIKQSHPLEAARFLLSRIKETPSIGIVSGTGLDCLSGAMTVDYSVLANDIPYFPSVELSERSILLGRMEGHPAVLLNRRLHFYEGFSMAQIAFVIRLFKKLGVRLLIITNAAGGLNPLYSAGQIMLIVDHINLMGDSPLRGPNSEEYGQRFPDMTAPYDSQLIQLMEETATTLAIPIWKGIYVGVPGPQLETKAETKFLRAIGADAVGMSTVPEVITAVHCGMRVLGVSVLSNINLPDFPKVHTLEEIIQGVQKASPTLLQLIKGFLKKLPEEP